MENNSNKWKGNDVSLSECIEEYGMVYTYDGYEFNGWIADGVDKDDFYNDEDSEVNDEDVDNGQWNFD